MKELLFLLFNGPTLAARPVKTPLEIKTGVSASLIAKFRAASVKNRISAPQAVKALGVTHKYAGHILRTLCAGGALKEVGRVEGTRSTSPPYIYEWLATGDET